jgi:glycosyltransferase involved in cell wall biosynthesis
MSNYFPIRLGFYYHIPAIWDGNNVHVPAFLGRFLDGLARQCDYLTCFLPEAQSRSNRRLCDYTCDSKNIAFINLGQPCSALRCSFLPFNQIKHFAPYQNELDALIIRGPSPLLPALANAMNKTPIILLLVGDYQESSADSPLPFWRKSFVRLWVKWYTNQQIRIARRSLTIVNSRRLYLQYKPNVPYLFETRTTTLNNADFFLRSDTCQNRTIHLLYVGRYSASKGIFEIIEALALLKEKGIDAVLDLVGWPDRREEDIIQRLLIIAKKMKVSSRLIDHSYKTIGPELFALYRKADIFILASRSSFEGFPRAIWEAMSQGLPIVATSVGSIPEYLRNGRDALIVPPKSPEALMNAVSELTNNNHLRMKLIKNGYILAKKNLTTTRSREMVQQIKNWVKLGSDG